MRRLPLVLLLLAAACTHPSRPPMPAPALPVVTLGLVVTDARTGAAIAGARVDVQYTETADDGQTDAAGYWAALAPAYAPIVATVRAEGYQDGTIRLESLWDNRQVAMTLAPSQATAVRPIMGRLRLAGMCYRDDTGCVLPLYAHAGNLFALFVRDAARALTELDAVAAAGYHGVRTWSTLGGSYWDGWHVGDAVTEDYPGAVQRFFAAVAARRLRLVWSQGDIGRMRDRRATMALFARLDAEAGGVIDWIDCGNEAWQTGEPDPQRLAACVGYYRAAGGRALLTLTDAPIYGRPDPPGVTFDAYSLPPADAFDVHSYRGGHSWDKRRHAWGYTYEHPPRLLFGISSEPPGAGARVSVTTHQHELDAEALSLLAIGSLLGRQAFVWFSGEGVMIDRGLATEAGFRDTPRAVALLPADVMTYRTSHHSGDSWRGTRVLVAQGEVRVDGRMADDGRFAYTLDGPPGSYRLRVERGFRGRLCHPGTAACEDVRRRAGDLLDVTFVRGRLLVGQVE